jgi:hypothetical protein
MYVALLTLMLAALPPAPDTLVICPDEFRSALDAWVAYRQDQGHQILVVPPSQRPAELTATIARVAKLGKLKCLVLVGDVAAAGDSNGPGAKHNVPTNHVAAKINRRWGSGATIATDIPYADTDGDGLSDLMIGRIPADSPDELRRTVRKVIQYERESAAGSWQCRLDIVAGIGGFGALFDAVIEASARQVFQQATPPGYELRHVTAKSASFESNTFREIVCNNLNEGSLAWIYLGHGRSTELDHVPTPGGYQPILSVHEVAGLRCHECRPLAVLIACSTGAFDARSECLAEELALAEEGPIAVIAATRVTMPYGNTVFGYELLRACLHDRPLSLGESIRLAQRRTIAAEKNDAFRPSLDSLAEGLSPPPVDLATERREHAMMYHLFGDPLLRLRVAPREIRPAPKLVAPVNGTAISK